LETIVSLSIAERNSANGLHIFIRAPLPTTTAAWARWLTASASPAPRSAAERRQVQALVGRALLDC